MEKIVWYVLGALMLLLIVQYVRTSKKEIIDLKEQVRLSEKVSDSWKKMAMEETKRASVAEQALQACRIDRIRLLSEDGFWGQKLSTADTSTVVWKDLSGGSQDCIE